MIYGISSGSNNRTISRYDFSTDTYASVVNLDTIIRQSTCIFSDHSSWANAQPNVLVLVITGTYR